MSFVSFVDVSDGIREVFAVSRELGFFKHVVDSLSNGVCLLGFNVSDHVYGSFVLFRFSLFDSIVSASCLFDVTEYCGGCVGCGVLVCLGHVIIFFGFVMLFV